MHMIEEIQRRRRRKEEEGEEEYIDANRRVEFMADNFLCKIENIRDV